MIISLAKTFYQKPMLSMRQIAKLPLTERHKYLKPYILKTAEDFRNDPELTEFSILDTEDWDIELLKINCHEKITDS